ncbi:MAG: T9SS type A sorting domain-containing protein [Fibrobacterota bacterium]
MFKAFTAFLLLLICFSLSALDIPIKVREALPGNIATGWARSGEPVKLGVPLMDKEGISSENQLSIQGLSDYQFRIMERYPSGNIRWLLVDFPATVNASDTATYHLVDGSGQPSGNLAVDNGTTLTITTGAMTATVKKTNTNILDAVSVGGVAYIASGNAGGLVLVTDTDTFTTLNDEDSCRAVIEENGPYRACVRVTGAFQKAGSDTLCMGYTLRLHFFKGQAYLKAALTLRNDLWAQRAPVKVLGLHWVLKTTLSSAPAYALAGTDGALSGSLDEQVSLVQGLSMFRTAGSYDAYYVRWGVGKGYRVDKGVSRLHDYSADSMKYANGYAEVTDGTKRINLAYKQLSGWWAGGFELNPDGTLALCHISTHRDSACLFSFFCHETREFLVSFGGSETGAQLETRANYPVFALCDFDRYRKTGAFLAETRLADFNEMKAFLSGPAGVSNFRPGNVREDAWPAWGTGFSKIGPRREAASSGGGPSGNMMHGDAAVLRAMQTGWGGMWLLAEYWVNSICDYPLEHTWGYKPWDIDVVFNYVLSRAGSSTCNGFGVGYKTWVEYEHPHWLSIIPWYYLTGDERVRENWESACNHRIHQRWEAKDNLLALTTTTTVGYERVYTYDVRDVAVVNWLIPRDSTEKAFLTYVMRNLIRPECSNTAREKPGWDPYRGFWKVNGTGDKSDGKRWIHSFFAEEKHAENTGLIQLMWPKLLPDSLSLKNKLRDRLLGFAYFDQKEFYVRRASGNYNVFYDYCVDSLQTDITNAQAADDATFLQAYGFEQTGDTAFLNTGVHLYYPVYNSTYCDEYLNKTTMLRFIYDYNRKDSITVTYPALNVVNNSGGSYSLSWAAPVGGVDEYVLKYSPKQIVPNLNFDRVTRSYEYDTAQYVNFWAADEPAVNPAASASTFDISGLETTATYYFSLKAIRDRSVERDGPVAVEEGLPGSGETASGITAIPNPFNPSVTLSIAGLRTKPTDVVSVKIYDVRGKRVKDLSAEFMRANRVAWNAGRCASGIYIVRATCGGRTTQKRITVLK